MIETTLNLDVEELRERLGAVVNHASEQLAELGQITAGLAFVDPECLPADGAGYGSNVVVKDIDTGEVVEYTLMVGALVDLQSNHVSLGSPVGQALLGHGVGDHVTVRTPQRTVRYLIIRLRTLQDSLDLLERNQL